MPPLPDGLDAFFCREDPCAAGAAVDLGERVLDALLVAVHVPVLVDKREIGKGGRAKDTLEALLVPCLFQGQQVCADQGACTDTACLGPACLADDSRADTGGAISGRSLLCHAGGGALALRVEGGSLEDHILASVGNGLPALSARARRIDAVLVAKGRVFADHKPAVGKRGFALSAHQTLGVPLCVQRSERRQRKRNRFVASCACVGRILRVDARLRTVCLPVQLEKLVVWKRSIARHTRKARLVVLVPQCLQHRSGWGVKGVSGVSGGGKEEEEEEEQKNARQIEEELGREWRMRGERRGLEREG